MKTIKTDLTVIGGGIAGICCAISAARNGIKVALLNDRDVPGGNASSEHRIHINGGGSGNKSFYSRETGVVDEIKQTVFHQNPKYNKKFDFHLSDMAIDNIIFNEPNILYFPGTVAYDCETKDSKITKVFAFKSKTNDNFTFDSPLFCEASGDGVIAYKAGAEYRVGREAKSEFNESLAPEKADKGVMGSCILYSIKNADHKVEFVKPPFAYDFVKDGIIKYFDRPETGRSLPSKDGPFGGTWWLEYGGLNDTIAESDDIDLELKKLVFSYWDYIKNSGKYPKADNCYIAWIAPYASKRESRRFVGDYIMTQNDIQTKKDFKDAVSTGGWSLDIHDVGGIYGTENTSAFGDTPTMYNIPYSIMYSKNINNLFLAGRTISSSHVAFGSLRVMQTLGAMGQAVGTAAALCNKYSSSPRDIENKYIKELQTKLQLDGQYIIGIKEDCGLAEKATISASSTRKLANTDADIEFDLNKDVVFALPYDNNHKSVKIKVRNNSSDTVNLDYEIYSENKFETYIKGDLINSNTVEISPIFDDYATLEFDINTKGKKLFIQLKSNDNITIFASKDRITGAPCFYENGWRTEIGDDVLTFCFKDYEAEPKLYCACNIANGFSRPVGMPNCWISENNIDEWIALDFENPVDMKQLHLVFNSQLENDHFNNPIKQLITDYEIIIKHKNGTYTQTIKDNFLGLNIHNINLSNVEQIKIKPLKNNGAKWFEIFAVKVF